MSASVAWSHRDDTWTSLVASIADGAVDRELRRTHPLAAVSALAAAGFGALRVPELFGGADVSLPELFAATIAVSAADSNVAQIFRAHFGLVEHLRSLPDSVQRTHWLSCVGSGRLLGNATTERGGHPDEVATTLRRDGDRWVLDGVKHYCTGTLMADDVAVLARAEDSDAPLTAIVPVGRAGVTVLDDWDAIGQRTTGTGTSIFASVVVHEVEILPTGPQGPSAAGAFYQLMLLAVSAGIARRVVEDVGDVVRGRARPYAHGVGERPALDPIVQVEVGEIAAAAYAAEAVVMASAAALQRAVDGGTESDLSAAFRAVSAAQVAMDDLVLSASVQLFDAGSASAVSTARGYDRHWRNARTVASHNSCDRRAQALGDHLLNGTRPPFGGW